MPAAPWWERAEKAVLCCPAPWAQALAQAGERHPWVPCPGLGPLCSGLIGLISSLPSSQSSASCHPRLPFPRGSGSPGVGPFLSLTQMSPSLQEEGGWPPCPGSGSATSLKNKAWPWGWADTSWAGDRRERAPPPVPFPGGPTCARTACPPHPARPSRPHPPVPLLQGLLPLLIREVCALGNCN